MAGLNVHILPNRSNHSISIFLILIPAIIFVLTLVFLSSARRGNPNITTIEEPSVLGETQELDLGR